MKPAAFRRLRNSPGRFARTACVAVLAAAAWPGVRPARGEDPIEDRRALLRQQRERYEAGVALDPELDDKTHRVTDLFQLSLHDGRLVLTPGVTMTALHVARRARIEGLDSPATVVFSASLGRRPGMGHARFDFSAERFDEEACVYTRLHVFTYSRNLRAVQEYRAGDTQWDVSLEEAGESVRLGVSGSRIDAVNLVEADFTTLRRRHPLETGRWLWPMLRELGQERLLAPDPPAAWQVLADDWPEDPAVRRKVLELLPELGPPDFHVREAAARKITDLGFAGATSVLRLDAQGVRYGLSAEQSRELDAIVAPRRVLPAEEAAALRDNTEFLLDCLSCGDATARAVALGRLKKLAPALADFDGKDLTGDADHRAAAIAALRERALSAAIAATQPAAPRGADGATEWDRVLQTGSTTRPLPR